MDKPLDYIVAKIAELNPLHSKKIKKNLKKKDDLFFSKAEEFLSRYNTLLKNEDKSLDFAIDCYLHMISDINYETVQFMESGEYSSKSFNEVNQRVYNNPDVMDYYMHGLLLSQFLWSHHYDILLSFIETIRANKNNIHRYLEVGGGHGLYISEAIKILPENTEFTVVDISKSSLDLAQKLVPGNKANFIVSDIFLYNPAQKFDFITMGEVLEHVEDPVALLKRLEELLSDKGKIYITTPTNAPTIDHIYLFKNADDIREVIARAGLKIEKEECIYSEDLPPELLEQYKISMMYVALLTK
jgi:2-polyprenyl-3-methyl-5-hydroxy-6-metoxy-1,4-benzoquinol methylase